MQLCLPRPSAASISRKTTNLNSKRWEMERGSISHIPELCEPKSSVLSVILPEPRRGLLGLHAVYYKAEL